MDIALVVDRFDGLGGGLERWTVALARHLLAAGHTVQVVCFEQASHGLPVAVHVLAHRSSALARGRAIAVCVAGLGADVVHDSGSGWSGDVFHPQTGSHLASMEREIASHTLFRRLKAGVSPRTNLRRWRMARAESRQAAGARRLIAVSHRIRADLQARHGVAPERIVVIPNGAETARYHPDRIAGLRMPARQAMGAGGSVLFLGSAHNMRLKGMDDAIRALAVLREAGADARLAIAGGRPDGWWHGLVNGLGLGAHVRFLGPVDDMAPLFAAADALVHPTRWDACSLSTIEGAAAGLPVITTAMNGAAELIRDGETGFVLPRPGDVGALAASMRLLLEPGLRARVGAAALADARHHDIADNLRAVESVLISVGQSG